MLPILLLLVFSSSAGVQAQDPDAEAERLFAEMTIEERVGQLFLIPFVGDTLTADSDIADLLGNYKVGGVILLPENDNLTGYGEPQNTPEQLLQLTSDLQTLALLGEVPQPTEGEETVEGLAQPETPAPTPSPVPVGLRLPLFVAMSHDSQARSGQHHLGGLTAIPTNMAVGATWEPEFARSIGHIVGKELAAVGVNMLLGPTLDVLANPAPLNPSDLGTKTFGGDPYWVGRMGQAYTTGVHEGSGDRIAVIAKNFPGKGSSDRLTEEEIPTVQKSFELLKQTELAPFMAVTGNTAEPAANVDGMLSTHVRYRGLQGNTSATTAPISFDPQALNSLMAMPEFSAWRSGGGMLVSDALGVRSVERFYDDTEQEFPHRRVAKDALLAGNDLLYLGDFALGTAPVETQVENIKDTILWFQEKYETDQSFRQRIDEASMRVLRKKLELYGGEWSPENVVPNSDALPGLVGQDNPAVFDLAQNSMTLISPSLAELSERLASPPGFGESIVVFTDVREAQQCSECPEDAVIGETAIADRLIALYGPQGSNQISSNQISSFSFDDLSAFLEAGGATIVLPTPETPPTLDPEVTTDEPTPFLTPTPLPGFLVQEALRDADWIVFGLLDGAINSAPLARFLTDRPDILRDRRVLVFALDAPYYLDTTEISKLTGYYGVYSTSEMFVDTAVRTLFMEAPLNGKSPVSIDGMEYDLSTITQPDPQQFIEVKIISDAENDGSPQSAPLQAEIGDTLQLETGIIIDRNGNQVPDGTDVQFILQDRIQGTLTIIDEVQTTSGVARLGYVLEASTGPGQFRITVESGEATASQAVDISIEEEAGVIIVVPTIAPSPTPSPSPTATITPQPTPTLTPVPPTSTPPPPPIPEEPGIRIALSELEMLLSMLSGLALFTMGALILGRNDPDAGHRAAAWLWGLVGGLLAYIYALLQLPGSSLVLSLGSWAGLTTTLLGAAAGWLLYQVVTTGRPRPSQPSQ